VLNKRLLTLLFVATVCVATVSSNAEPGRVVVDINADWVFDYFPAPVLDDSMAASGLDDSDWPAVALPHTWSTYETTGDEHPFILHAAETDDPYWWRGWGWYRKKLIMSEAIAGSVVSVEFDGVQKYSRIYVNGEFAGDHSGGYTSFSVDISEFIRPGEVNQLAVAVSNRRDDEFGGIPPMTAGNFNVYGGIYRNARMVIRDRLHIPFQGNADHEGGTFVTTPEVSAELAHVRVRTYVRNEYPDPVTATLVTSVVNSDNDVVATDTEELAVPASEMVEFDQALPAIENPELWSPDEPNMYRVRSVLMSGDRIVDKYTSPLGFRWFHWDYENDVLYVNDEPVHIHGTNRHQEYPWLGDAMPRWLHVQEMQEIRYSLGHNFMRTAHYPNDPIIYELTDELGIVTAEEVPNIKSIDFSEEIQDQNLREMIRRDRNHPSIFFWSVGNETNDAGDSCIARAEDPTRIIHHRKTEGHGDCVDHSHRNLDMESLLRVTIRGWYNRDIKNLEPANSVDLPKSGQSAGHEVWQHKQARIDGGSIRGRIDRQGVAWLYADHGASRIYENAPLRNVNAKGWVDLYRVPKYMYYLWRANYSNEPMVFVQPHYWREEYLGTEQQFQVDSNCESVELLVNGQSYGRRRPGPDNFHTVTFEAVPVSRGTLSARCIEDSSVRSEVSMAGPPSRLVLVAERDEIIADRSGISVLEVRAVDADGRTVMASNPRLRWEISGPGKLVGPAEYVSDIAKRHAESGVQYIYLPIKNVIRSTAKPGEITVRVFAEGLAPAEATIRSIAAQPVRNEFVEQIGLNDEGRRYVVRDPDYVASEAVLAASGRLSPVLSEYQQYDVSDELKLRNGLREFVRNRNTAVDPESPNYEAFIEYLVATAKRTGGEIIPDDYNFAVDRFNLAQQLAALVDASNLHLRFAEQLRTFYAGVIITRGQSPDADAEKELIELLGRESKFAHALGYPPFGRDVHFNNVTKTYRVGAGDFGDLVGSLYAEFDSLAASDRAMVCRNLRLVNLHGSAANNTENPCETSLLRWKTFAVPSPESLLDLSDSIRRSRTRISSGFSQPDSQAGVRGLGTGGRHRGFIKAPETERFVWSQPLKQFHQTPVCGHRVAAAGTLAGAMQAIQCIEKTKYF